MRFALIGLITVVWFSIAINDHAVKCNSLDSLKSNINALVDQLDDAKEFATGCRNLARILLEPTKPEDVRIIDSIARKSFRVCYPSMNSIIGKKFEQLGLLLPEIKNRHQRILAAGHATKNNWLSGVYGIKTDHDYVNQVRDYDRDYKHCFHLTTGILGDFITILNLYESKDKNILFEKQFEYENDNILTLLEMARVCGYKPSQVLGYGQTVLMELEREKLDCRNDIPLVKKLYHDQQKSSSSGPTMLDLSIATRLTLNTCLIELRKAFLDKGFAIDLKQNGSQLGNSLIEYLNLNDSYLGDRTSLLDRMNPRSLLGNEAESGLYMNTQAMINFDRFKLFYNGGKGICEQFRKVDWYSNQDGKLIVDLLESIQSLLAIPKLQVNLRHVNDNDLLQSIMIQYGVCKNIELYKMKIE